MHIKVKGTDTKETKAINTKVLSSMVTRVIKAVSDKEAKEAKELVTKVVIKELDTKEAIRGHGPVVSKGSPEMTVGEVAKAKVAEVMNIGRSQPQRETGDRLKWTSMQKSAHVRTVPKTRVGHGTIRHGKIRKIRQGATTANMTRSKKRWQDTNARRSNGRRYRELCRSTSEETAAASTGERTGRHLTQRRVMRHEEKSSTWIA